MKRILTAGLLVVLTACGEDALAPPAHVTCDAFLLQQETATGDTVEAGDGLRYIDVRPGSGAAAGSGTTVDLNYSGYLTDGTRFDTSCPTARDVLRFTIGAGDVIPGFERGVSGMREGGIRRIIIPPHLGYGSAPVGPIPANSTLIFDVELVALPGR